MMARVAATLLLFFLFLAPAPAVAQSQETACVACHTMLEDDASAAWARDVHRDAGLGCESCHGGDPDASLFEDPDVSMSEQAGFHPAPGRLEVADFCARCHADAEFMKRYDPQARVDQLTEYRTSGHGRKNAGGDPNPATCTDCHGAHGVLPVTSPEAPVYAINVPETCARCHADPERMEASGLPTDQYEDFRASVHGAVLLEVGDTAAPACNDCHGNHGATPPGVQSLAFVCGNCHGREAALFRASFKKGLFDDMEVAECTVCHGYHRVKHPSPELFHGGSAPTVSAGEVISEAPLEAVLGDLKPGGRAEARWIAVLRSHMEEADQHLAHSIVVESEGAELLVLDATLSPGADQAPPRQAEADGLTVTLSMQPTTGWPLEAGDAVRYTLELQATEAIRAVTVHDRPGPGLDAVAGSACLTCHTPGDACDLASEKMYDALITLERDIKSADALLHRAELSGMEVRGPQFQLKSQARTASVEARALIHAFDPERLIARSEEGREVAGVAHAAGEDALAELQFRRKGLGISLLLILLVLVGLAAKIRDVDRRRAAGNRTR
jgi:Cytochrome c3